MNPVRATAADAPKAKAAERPTSKSKGKALKTLPDFIEPQFCKLVDRPPPGAQWAHEIKFDGYRMQMRVEGGKATLRTRKGLDWTHKFSAIAKDGAALPDCIVDGEICALDDKGSPSFAGLQAALSAEKTDDLIFFVFDLLAAESSARDPERQWQAILNATVPQAFYLCSWLPALSTY